MEVTEGVEEAQAVGEMAEPEAEAAEGAAADDNEPSFFDLNDDGSSDEEEFTAWTAEDDADMAEDNVEIKVEIEGEAEAKADEGSEDAPQD
eukprot:3380392-Prymnesium_polylepis.1